MSRLDELKVELAAAEQEEADLYNELCKAQEEPFGAVVLPELESRVLASNENVRRLRAAVQAEVANPTPEDRTEAITVDIPPTAADVDAHDAPLTEAEVEVAVADETHAPVDEVITDAEDK